MKAPLILSLALAACAGVAPREEGSVPVAAMMEYNFDHDGTTYPIRLVDGLDGLPGDLTVYGLDPSTERGNEEKLAEVAEAACLSEGRIFDHLSDVRAEGDGLTFVGACL